MLEKAIFRKHTKLILYMASRQFFSQKEIIRWCLSNNEFKDKDSWENKGQFKDKLISYGVLKKYTNKEFQKIYPDEMASAGRAYTGTQERKRCLLVFDSDILISLDYPKLKGIHLPFKEYIDSIETDKEISEIAKAFVFGCSIQRIHLLGEKLSKDFAKLVESRQDIDETLLALVRKARDIMEKNIKNRMA